MEAQTKSISRPYMLPVHPPNPLQVPVPSSIQASLSVSNASPKNGRNARLLKMISTTGNLSLGSHARRAKACARNQPRPAGEAKIISFPRQTVGPRQARCMRRCHRDICHQDQLGQSSGTCDHCQRLRWHGSFSGFRALADLGIGDFKPFISRWFWAEKKGQHSDGQDQSHPVLAEH